MRVLGGYQREAAKRLRLTRSPLRMRRTTEYVLSSVAKKVRSSMPRSTEVYQLRLTRALSSTVSRCGTRSLLFTGTAKWGMASRSLSDPLPAREEHRAAVDAIWRSSSARSPTFGGYRPAGANPYYRAWHDNSTMCRPGPTLLHAVKAWKKQPGF